MVRYLIVVVIFFAVSCSKSKEEEETPQPIGPEKTICNKNWVKEYAGHYQLQRYWPDFDSLNHVTWIYDTVFEDCSLEYLDCNKLLFKEQNITFPFDSVFESSVNLSKDPMWTSVITLTIVNKDSIRIYEEYGHLGRMYVWYVGRKE